MKMEEYDTVDQMVTDVELMINNALAYYKVRATCLKLKNALLLRSVNLRLESMSIGFHCKLSCIPRSSVGYCGMRLLGSRGNYTLVFL